MIAANYKQYKYKYCCYFFHIVVLFMNLLQMYGIYFEMDNCEVVK
nr:MAG TPA: hypothetical protein [Caudoviricetes sp.]